MSNRAVATVLVALLSSAATGQALACSATTPCINEILAEPPGGPSAQATSEYLEFRFTPGATLPENTYFVAIEGDFQANRNQGSVDSIIDMSGLTFGANGFLVLLPGGNTFTVHPDAAVVTSTTAGFGGLPNGIWQGDEGAINYERPSTSFFLITSAIAPQLSDDVDVDDDGVIDPTSFLATATMLDSVGIADNPNKDRSYAAINFRIQDDGSPTTIVIAARPMYMGRFGDSFGSAASAWAASAALGGTNPNFLLSATVTYPDGIQGKPLNHIGTTNAWLNIAPEVNIDATASTLEDAPLTYAGNLSITDADSAGAAELVAITVTNGTLSLSGVAGLTFSAGDGTADAAMTFTGSVAAINAALNNAVFTPAAEFSGDATVTVNVNDQGNTGIPNQALSDEETQTITVGIVNDPPVVANQSFTVSEDAADGTAVGTVVASDVDGPALSYSITTVQADFAIDSATGAITVAAGAALDFETTPSYSLTVQVTDGTTPVTATITIDVTNVNDNGPAIAAGQVFTIVENAPNGSAVSPGPVVASDPDNDTLSYSLAVPSTAFSIIAATGQIVVANTQLIDFETNPTFTLTVAVSDGTNSAQESVTVNVIDVSGPPAQAPVVHDQSFAVNENAPNGTIVGAVFAVDEDGPSITYAFNPASTAFSINPANGQISVADSAQLDFETTPVFTLTVEVSDGTLSDTATITINVNDIAVEDPAPSVVSIDRLGANPATSSPVQFTVTFSETVNGVDSGDFSIPVSGTVTGAAITALNCTNATCTVTVGFSGANGTLGLDLVDNDSIVDATAQPLGGAGAGNGDFTGQIFDIDTDGAGDTTPPVVNSVVRANPSPSPGPTVDFIVTFSETVTGVDVNDFQLTVTGALVTPSITGVSGSGSTYTVTVATGTGIGTIRLDVIDDDSVIDGESNPLGGAGMGNGAFTTGEVYSIDTINGIPIFKDGFENPPAP